MLYPRLEQEGLRQKTDKMKLKPDLEANCNQSHQTGKGQDENGARTSTEGADEKLFFTSKKFTVPPEKFFTNI